MAFVWTQLLWLLLVVPVLTLVYGLLQHRKRKLARRYSSLFVGKDAIAAGMGFRRHIPPILLLLALTLMIAAIARPQAVLRLPSQRSTVILSIDVSGSMKAEDMEPNRLAAAQAAAKAFVQAQPLDVRIGVVAFAGAAFLVQVPTSNREDVLKAIDHFELQGGTNIGDGILVSLQTLFPGSDSDLSPRDQSPDNSNSGTPLGRSHDTPGETKESAPMPLDSKSSSVIILLSDGERTTGPNPADAARKAAERGVRVFTVGLGSIEGTVVGFGGQSMRVVLDEEVLKKIADLTSASYSHASTAADLKKIYKSLNKRWIMETKKTEITALFSAASAAVLAFLAIGTSLLWFNRIS